MKKAKTILLISALLLTFMLTKTINVMQDTEIWKAVPGYEGYYQVSSHGNVKSLYRNRLLRPTIQAKNVCRVKLYKAHELKCFCVHRLVGLAFFPNPENKPQINHIDANRLNNHYSNLEWVTPQENIDHAELNNLVPRMIGERNGNTKFTANDVLRIREMRGYTSSRKLARKFDVSKGCIDGIVSRRNWKHV